ncbi:bifunctional DNA primase/polymerase-like protein [Asanoa ferruginea]|uniref:Bifunctional DNA primase/polymerase-like protein n=1 Tax=Asanoa ferruginea TaxID=53367 RepID=A0A3D9ZZ67_9ACTN|nr:bifunctional DNA primase/polymerase [Asanoa ferruginea]REG02310.1 bifunctional DNA primase/polymerase-like protein [Asanoa ferruginea]
MRWNIRPPFARVTLRRSAMRYADHRWEVMPGAWLDGSRFACERPGCPTTSCHPALEGWERRASTDPSTVEKWWRQRPHAVLLATGHAFDVLEVPNTLGGRVLAAARMHAGVLGPGRLQVRGPVAATPLGRWMFLVRPGDPLRPELENSLDVVRHGTGSWVPAPPTRLPEGLVRWVVAPEEVAWTLPDSYAVQRMIVDSVFTRPSGMPHLPRQLSTARRAA